MAFNTPNTSLCESGSRGEESITNEELLDGLLKFVANDESDAIKDCLSGKLECNSDEITDVLSVYDVRQVPNRENVTEVFTKLAHKRSCRSPVISPRDGVPFYDLYMQILQKRLSVYMRNWNQQQRKS